MRSMIGKKNEWWEEVTFFPTSLGGISCYFIFCSYPVQIKEIFCFAETCLDSFRLIPNSGSMFKRSKGLQNQVMGVGGKGVHIIRFAIEIFHMTIVIRWQSHSKTLHMAMGLMNVPVSY